MTNSARATVEKLFAALADRDLEAVGSVYGDDAELVRYDGVAKGRDEIQAFYGRYLTNHKGYELDQIVDFRAVDDVALWDAMVKTDAGILMTYHVAIVDNENRLVRHVPTVRGYWGQ